MRVQPTSCPEAKKRELKLCAHLSVLGEQGSQTSRQAEPEPA